MYVYTYECMYHVYMFVCIYICAYICMHVCMYVSIYTVLEIGGVPSQNANHFWGNCELLWQRKSQIVNHF